MMKQNERLVALLGTEWQTTLRNSVKRLGGTVRITGNLVRLYSGGVIPPDTMRAFKDAMEKHDPKKLLVITLPTKDRP